MSSQYDVVVIGSGFGGAITACRLAQAGRSVCLLEKGRRWDRLDFPRGSGEVGASTFAAGQAGGPTKGFVEYRCFRDMDVVQGTGVGGGSLHYFNVHKRPPAFIFEQARWPKGVTLQRLNPYYELAADMLRAREIRADDGHGLPRRTQVFEDAVASLGREAERVPICVRFAQHGADAGCDHCGNCLLGCHKHAKNTLDLNYIPLAEHHGAVLFQNHEALNIRPQAKGYIVTCRDLACPPGDEPQASIRYFSAAQVVVAAGTLGTNELLLRSREVARTLPDISGQLGKQFSGNGDFIFAGTRYQSRIVDPGRGPSITAGVGFRKGEQYIYIEDLGYPDPFIWYFNQAIPTRSRLTNMLKQSRRYFGEAMGRDMKFELEALLQDGYLTHFLPYLGMGTDAANGSLTLDAGGRVKLNWSTWQSLPMFTDMLAHMKALSEASGGRFVNSFLWQSPSGRLRWNKTLTAHPLGGCAMADSPREGVTNEFGEVFGYKGLFVADGALMPAAIGVNPSATISATAERVAFHMIHKRDMHYDDAHAPVNVASAAFRLPATITLLKETTHE